MYLERLTELNDQKTRLLAECKTMSERQISVSAGVDINRDDRAQCLRS